MRQLLIMGLTALLIVSCSKQSDSLSNKKTEVTNHKEVKKESKEVKKESKEIKKESKEVKKATKVEIKGTDREKLAKFALTFEDKALPKDSRWNNFSSGFVKMVYLNFNVDLYDVAPELKKTEDGKWLGGVELIHKYVETNGELFNDRLPKKGDIIFLDNTFDADKDKKVNDKLTSIGIVVDVDSEETVHFLYKGSKGISLKQINLKLKEQESIKNKNVVKTINSKMRWFSKKDKEKLENTPELTSQLFNSYGTLLDVDTPKGKTTLDTFAFKMNLSQKDREKVAKFALTFEDKELPKGSRWNNFSSGFIKMIFLNFKLDLYNIDSKLKKTEDGKWLGGVELIHKYVETNGELFNDRLPKKGDIIFLDNTFDADKDKIVNDKLTSIGIVVDVDNEETVHFLYKGSKGISLKQINLKLKEQENIKNKNVVKTINSKMRWFSKKDKEKSENTPELTSQLFNSYGSIFK